jgi:hypothetical protein
MTTRRAACSCGQLQLMIEGEPSRISMCHCLECQRRTGAVISNQAVSTLALSSGIASADPSISSSEGGVSPASKSPSVRPPRVWADRIQLQQVILNLIVGILLGPSAKKQSLCKDSPGQVANRLQAALARSVPTITFATKDRIQNPVCWAPSLERSCPLWVVSSIGRCNTSIKSRSARVSKPKVCYRPVIGSTATTWLARSSSPLRSTTQSQTNRDFPVSCK